MNAIPADRWLAFLALVEDTRQIQKHYRRTMDPLARREAERLEDRLDAEAVALRLSIELGVEPVEDLDRPAEAEASPAIAAEGGAP